VTVERTPLAARTLTVPRTVVLVLAGAGSVGTGLVGTGLLDTGPVGDGLLPGLHVPLLTWAILGGLAGFSLSGSV